MMSSIDQLVTMPIILAKMQSYLQSKQLVLDMCQKKKNGESLKRRLLKEWTSLEFYSMVMQKMLIGMVLNLKLEKPKKELNIKAPLHYKSALL